MTIVFVHNTQVSRTANCCCEFRGLFSWLRFKKYALSIQHFNYFFSIAEGVNSKSKVPFCVICYVDLHNIVNLYRVLPVCLGKRQCCVSSKNFQKISLSKQNLPCKLNVGCDIKNKKKQVATKLIEVRSPPKKKIVDTSNKVLSTASIWMCVFMSVIKISFFTVGNPSPFLCKE